MFAYLNQFAVVVLVANSTALFAQEGWPKPVERAWLIKEAKVLGDEAGDPAAVGNILLLVGQRLYLAADQNIANDHDYSQSPMLLEKGFRVEDVEHSEEMSTIAYARHQQGMRKLVLSREKDEGYSLQITFTDPVSHHHTEAWMLEEIEQKVSKDRVKKILAVGELEGSIQMRPLNDWLARE